MKGRKLLKAMVIMVALVLAAMLSLTACTTSKKYTLTLVASPVEGGTVSQSGSGTYVKNKNITVTAVPDANYTFDGWYIGDTLKDSSLSYSFKMPGNDLELTAKFAQKQPTQKYTVTFDLAGGIAEFDLTAEVAEGEAVAKPTPNPTKVGYKFVNWTLNGTAYNFSASVTSNITLVAVWEKDEPLIVPTIEETLILADKALSEKTIKAASSSNDATPFLVSFRALDRAVAAILKSHDNELIAQYENLIKAKYDECNTFYLNRIGSLADSVVFMDYLNLYLDIADRWLNDATYVVKSGHYYDVALMNDFRNDIPDLYTGFYNLEGVEMLGFYTLLCEGGHSYFTFRSSIFNDMMEEYYYYVLGDIDYEIFFYFRTMAEESYIDYLVDRDADLFWFLDSYLFWWDNYFLEGWYCEDYDNYMNHVGFSLLIIDAAWENEAEIFEWPIELQYLEYLFFVAEEFGFCIENEFVDEVSWFIMYYWEFYFLREYILDDALLNQMYYQYTISYGRSEITFNQALAILDEYYDYLVWVQADIAAEFWGFFDIYLDYLWDYADLDWIYIDGEFSRVETILSPDFTPAMGKELYDMFMELSPKAQRAVYANVYVAYGYEEAFSTIDNGLNAMFNVYFSSIFTTQAELNAVTAIRFVHERYIQTIINDYSFYDPLVYFINAYEAFEVAYAKIVNKAAFDSFFSTEMAIYLALMETIPQSIEIYDPLNKTEYYVGDTLVLDGGSIEVTYRDGSKHIILLTNEGVTVSPRTLNEVGSDIVITVKYLSRSTTFTVKVNEKIVVSIDLVSYTGPTEFSVQDGDALGLINYILINIHWSDGSITYNKRLSDLPKNPNSPGIIGWLNSVRVAGDQIPITVLYAYGSRYDEELGQWVDIGGYWKPILTIYVKVNEVGAVSALSLSKTPQIKPFGFGATPDIYGFDFMGTDVIISYSGLADRKVDLRYFYQAGYIKVDTSIPGVQTVTVTYQGKTFTFDVTIDTPSISGISIFTQPTKVEYEIGETLDLTGGVLEVTLTGGGTIYVDMTQAQVGTYNFSTPGQKTIVLTYLGKTVNLTVTVLEAAQAGIPQKFIGEWRCSDDNDIYIIITESSIEMGDYYWGVKATDISYEIDGDYLTITFKYSRDGSGYCEVVLEYWNGVLYVESSDSELMWPGYIFELI